MRKTDKYILTVLTALVLILSVLIFVRADGPREYSGEDIMCLANMVYHEVSGVCLDDAYTWDEQQTILEQWAGVALNHLDWGYADSLPELMRMRTAAGYYVWHPKFATAAYQDEARAADPERYERCRIAAIAAMNGTGASLPSDVIYADGEPHGSVYREYTIDTGWYRSTVYLSHATNERKQWRKT